MRRTIYGVIAALLATAQGASAITREEVLVRARAYAAHQWTATAANMTASCKPSYRSFYEPGDFVGVAYDWGGYMSLLTFDAQIAEGYGAGSWPSDGVLSCTAGVDCSGFVSMAWGAGHHTTRSLHRISSEISAASILPGDVFNVAGYHVAMFTHLLASGEPVLIEAIGYNVHENTTGGWSYLSGYVPRRYAQITGTTAGNPLGTTTNPIVVTSFPFTDRRDTRDSKSSVLDACAAAPSVPEKGAEFVYVATLAEPGTLTVTIADDASTDVDVNIMRGVPSPHACVARGDSTKSLRVGCGTYYLVADTFGPDNAKAGPFTLTATFTPSGQTCATAAPIESIEEGRELGEACASSQHPDLGSCRGDGACVEIGGASFCSKPCARPSDCADVAPGGGCCQDLGKGETYCVLASLCGATLSGALPETHRETQPETQAEPAPRFDHPSGGGGAPSETPLASEAEPSLTVGPASGCEVSPNSAPAGFLAVLGLLAAAGGLRRRRGAAGGFSARGAPAPRSAPQAEIYVVPAHT